MHARSRSHPPRRRGLLARLTIAALVGVVLAWGVALAAVVVAANRDGARPAAAIIVLGAAQYDGRPSPVLRARLDHGIALWKQGLAPRLIVTGGRRAGDRTSEAATGRAYAVQHGVPDSAILLESEGRTTAQSLRAAAALLAEMARTAGGAAVPAPRSAVLVSDPFHMLRLRMLARRYGIVAYTSPTRTSPISAHRSAAFGYMVRESLKIPVVWLAESQADDGDDR